MDIDQKKDIDFRKQNVFLVTFTIVLFVFYYGSDSNYWGISSKNRHQIVIYIEYKFIQWRVLPNKTSEQILTDIGWGNIQPDEIKLKKEQIEEIEKMIIANPEKFNDSQKSLLRR
jgi:hypothetical protein